MPSCVKLPKSSSGHPDIDAHPILSGHPKPETEKVIIPAIPSRIGLILCLLLHPLFSQAADYSAIVHSAQLLTEAQTRIIEARIDYQLSATAKEALHKGVPLTWDVRFELRQPGWLWDSVLYRQSQTYGLQFHALLNQYAVQTANNHGEMFLTLSAALNYMSAVQIAIPATDDWPSSEQPRLLAIKTQFNRERLPIPLRPVAYLDHRWFLSSEWFTWSIQK